MGNQSEDLLIAKSCWGNEYFEKDIEDIFKMLNLFHDLEQFEATITGLGWSKIYQKYGLHGIIELDDASGWLGISYSDNGIDGLVDEFLSSGYNPVTGSLGKRNEMTFHDDSGRTHNISQILKDFREANNDIIKKPVFDVHPLQISQQEYQFKEGDILAYFNGFWRLRKVLKIDNFNLKVNDKVRIRGIASTALEDTSLTVVGVSEGGKTYLGMNDVRRAVKHKNWDRSIEHLPYRVSELGTDFKIVANKSVYEDELKAYNHWAERCKEGMLSIY